MQRSQRGVAYILVFAAAVCIVCGILVSSSAVTLQDRQRDNAELEKKTNVLQAAGLVEPGSRPPAEEVEALFARVEPVLVDLETHREIAGEDALAYDQQVAKSKPATSFAAPPNNAGIKRLPKRALVYKIEDESGALRQIVLPIEGLGLWSTLYGFIALDADFNTVRGLTFYQHGETPGLGGEVDNTAWKALWPGRAVYDNGEPALSVIKGQAGPPDQAPYQVDGLSGASITSRGVTNMLHFWLGPDGFEPYLETLKKEARS